MQPNQPSPHGFDVERWEAGFADESGAKFRDVVVDEPVLELSIFPQPIVGREGVWNAMRALRDMFERLEFTHQFHTEDRTYFEWEGAGVGVDVRGVTMFRFDEDGRVAHVALHHRPLGAVNRWLADLAERLSLC